MYLLSLRKFIFVGQIFHAHFVARLKSFCLFIVCGVAYIVLTTESFWDIVLTHLVTLFDLAAVVILLNKGFPRTPYEIVFFVVHCSLTD